MSKLTQKAAERAQPQAKRYFLYDHEVAGLRLTVYPSGEKSWQVRYRIGRGRTAPERVGTLGALALFTLEAAREKAKEVVVAGREGKDILAETLRTGELTVEVLWTEFYQEHKRKLEPETRRGYEREARCFIGRKEDDRKQEPGAFGRVPVAALTRGTLVRWQELNTHRPVLWNKSMKRLRQAWAWGLETRRIPKDLDSPFVRIDYFPETESAGTSYTMEEIQRLGSALDAADINPAYADGFRLMALTGCRPREIFSLRRDQVDLEMEVIRLQRNKQSVKTKTRKPRLLPITRAMRKILVERLAEVEPNCPWLFPANGTQYLQHWDEAWRKVREMAGVEGRCYDLRHNVGTKLAERNTNQAVIMAVMGHKRLETSQKYTTHFGLDPARAAMEDLSDDIAAAMEARPRLRVVR